MIKRIMYFLILISLLTGLFFGLGDQILYGKSTVSKVVPVVLIFFGIPFSLYKFLQTFPIKRSVLINTVVPLSILVLGPGFGFWTWYISENDLKKHGKWIYGKVIRKEWSSRRPRGWMLTGEFVFRDKKYDTFSELEDDKSYRIGDSVLIHFSTRNPENNELITD